MNDSNRTANDRPGPGLPLAKTRMVRCLENRIEDRIDRNHALTNFRLARVVVSTENGEEMLL